MKLKLNLKSNNNSVYFSGRWLEKKECLLKPIPSCRARRKGWLLMESSLSPGFTLVPTQPSHPVLPSPIQPLLQEGRNFHHFGLCFILRANTSLDLMHCGYWINIYWWPNDIPMADLLSGVLEALSCHRLNYTLLDSRDPVIGIHWYSIYLRISSLGLLKLNF